MVKPLADVSTYVPSTHLLLPSYSYSFNLHLDTLVTADYSDGVVILQLLYSRKHMHQTFLLCHEKKMSARLYFGCVFCDIRIWKMHRQKGHLFLASGQ